MNLTLELEKIAATKNLSLYQPQHPVAGTPNHLSMYTTPPPPPNPYLNAYAAQQQQTATINADAQIQLQIAQAQAQTAQIVADSKKTQGKVAVIKGATSLATSLLTGGFFGN